MEIATIGAEKRQELGKGAVGRLRRQGLVPAVVYGDKRTNLNLTIPAKELRQISLGSGQIFKVVVNGEGDYNVLIREVQKHPVSQEVIHLDLFEVSMTERLTTTSGLLIVGEAKGLSEGGILQHGLREVDIECLPADIPEAITVDVSALELGDQIKVGDLVAPSGVTILTDPEQLVVSLVAPQYDEEVEEDEDVDEEVVSIPAEGAAEAPAEE